MRGLPSSPGGDEVPQFLRSLHPARTGAKGGGSSVSDPPMGRGVSFLSVPAHPTTYREKCHSNKRFRV